MKFKKNLPNLLCIFRIIAAPIIMFMLLYNNYISRVFPFNQITSLAVRDFFDPSNSFIVLIAGAIFLLAVVTDAFDGYFARKYNAVSDKGKWLDPLADKILIMGTLIAFFFLEPNIKTKYIMIYPTLVIIFRELVITVLRSYCTKRGTVVAAMYWGKIKTVVQTIALLIYFVFEFCHYPIVGQVAVILASAFTLISLFPYLFKFYSILSKKEEC